MQNKKSYSNGNYDVDKINELVYDYRDGEIILVEEIIRECKDLIDIVFYKLKHRYGNRVCGHEDDIIQEGMMGIINAINTFDSKYKTKPTTHIYNSVYSSMQKHIRSFINKSNNIIEISEIERINLINDDSIGAVDKIVIEENITKILDVLSPKERDVIIAKFWWGFNNIDSGLYLGINQQTVSRRFKKAKHKIIEKFPDLRSDFFNE